MNGTSGTSRTAPIRLRNACPSTMTLRKPGLSWSSSPLSASLIFFFRPLCLLGSYPPIPDLKG